MGLPQQVVEFQCLLHRLPRSREGFAWCQDTINARHGVRICQAEVGGCIGWILPDRLLEVLPGPLEPLGCPPAPIVAALEIQLIGLWIFCALFGDLLFF